MIKLEKSLTAWGSPGFEKAFKNEIQGINTALLPLQSGLQKTSYATNGKIAAVVLNVSESGNCLHVKTSIFYPGVIAGSCCADDPTPVVEQTEHSEMQFDIDKKTAETVVTIL